MSLVQAVLDSSGLPVKGAFQLVPTEADANRFTDAEPGLAQIIHLSDPNRVELDLSGSPAGSTIHTLTLDFEFLVGRKQVMVALVPAAGGPLQWLPNQDEIEDAQEDPDWPGGLALTDSAMRYFSESTPSTVKVYNLGASPAVTAVRVFVPHTALPATLRDRVSIRSQSDNVAMRLEGAGDGLLFTAPSGAVFLLRVDDGGTPYIEPR